LVRPFDEEEIKYAPDQMEKNKAIGPDGFPIEFFLKYWVFIKQDIIGGFQGFS
jgi:hypothetical protein